MPVLSTVAENVKSTYLHEMENNSAGLKIIVSGVVLGRKATQEVRQGCLSQQLPAEIWTECFQIENNGGGWGREKDWYSKENNARFSQKFRYCLIRLCLKQVSTNVGKALAAGISSITHIARTIFQKNWNTAGLKSWYLVYIHLFANALVHWKFIGMATGPF